MSEKTEIMKKIRDIKLSKLRIKMDLTTLDMIIRFIYKPGVLRTRKALKNILSLIQSLDMSIYEEDSNEIESKNRLWIIETSLESILIEGLTTPDMMKKYCLDNPECNDYIITTLESILSSQSITYEESNIL